MVQGDLHGYDILGCPESSKRFLEKKDKINKYLLIKLQTKV
jgi:hypothetical protein